jgi:uncharacterized protein (DUF58 family)
VSDWSGARAPSARALALAGAGLAAILASRGFGTTALATLGVGLMALPVLVSALVWAAGSGLRLERRIEPARCRSGDPVVVRLAVAGWPVRLGIDLLLDVSFDPGLGALGEEGRAERYLGHAVRIPRAPRGDHALPPPRVRVADAFGLARHVHRGGGDDALLVLPHSPRLDRLALGGRAAGHGPRRRQALLGFGDLDRVRDYQPGDPLSRIHWGQTAKRGRLQTKELRPAQGSGRSTLVLLDGAAPPGPDFETAVTVAAAVSRHLAERREPLGFAHTGRRPVRIPAGRAGWPEVEMALARAQPGGERALALAVRAEAAAPDAPDLLVIATAAGDPGLPAAIAQARSAGVGVAVALTGPAAAGAADLARAGADVAIVAGPDRIAAALSDTGARARVS